MPLRLSRQQIIRRRLRLPDAIECFGFKGRTAPNHQFAVRIGRICFYCITGLRPTDNPVNRKLSPGQHRARALVHLDNGQLGLLIAVVDDHADAVTGVGYRELLRLCIRF